MLDINKRKFIICCCSLPIYFSKNYVFSDNENFDYLVKGPLAGSIYYTKKRGCSQPLLCAYAATSGFGSSHFVYSKSSMA